MWYIDYSQSLNIFNFKTQLILVESFSYMAFNLDIDFKEEFSKQVALLTHRFGVDKMDLIEDAIQEAFYKALKTWPNGPPQNPKGWIYRVARNNLIDKLRQKQHISIDQYEFKLSAEEDQWNDPQYIRDNQLKMIFACCHPDLKTADQLLLSLKFLCGFGSGQIARALLKSRSAIEKAIFRARMKFKKVATNLEIPNVADLKDRIDGVLKVIYLQFNEGYKVSEGTQLTNKDLCLDAIKLGELLVTYPDLSVPELSALLALMYFQASRLDARLDDDGNLLTLDRQDRKRWNYHYILQGNIYLSRAASGSKLSRYHLEATIASLHCAATSYDKTNWPAIVEWYDLAIRTNPNKSYRLNRLIAARQFLEVKTILKQVNESLLPKNQFTYIFLGDLYRDLGNNRTALVYYQKAGSLILSRPEKDFIAFKIDHLSN